MKFLYFLGFYILHAPEYSCNFVVGISFDLKYYIVSKIASSLRIFPSTHNEFIFKGPFIVYFLPFTRSLLSFPSPAPPPSGHSLLFRLPSQSLEQLIINISPIHLVLSVQRTRPKRPNEKILLPISFDSN